jgi:hypothetical protein
MGRGNRIVLPEPFDDQKSQVVRGDAFFTHEAPIAETKRLAKGRDWHGQQ